MRKLTRRDHYILLSLIRGTTLRDIGKKLNVTQSEMSRYMSRMRTKIEINTNFQLIAMYTIYLIENEEAELIDEYINTDSESRSAAV